MRQFALSRRIDNGFGWGLAVLLLVSLPAVAAPTTQPVKPLAYDWLIMDQHRQIGASTGVPSAVEMVLKLEHREPSTYFDLQTVWGNKTNGTLGDFDGRSVGGLTFHREFFLPRGQDFPIEKLFRTIDSELDAGRLVIASVSWGTTYNMSVIVGRTPSGEYRTVTKLGLATVELIDTKSRIRMMKGTDILTYTRTGEPRVAFTFDYTYQPAPGIRHWEQTDSNHWQEEWPNGHVDVFTIVGQVVSGDERGTIVRRYPDTGFEVLIPPLQTGNPIKFRRDASDSWHALGPIEIPGTKSETRRTTVRN